MKDLGICCPKCHKTTFKTTVEPKTLEDFYGAACANCGTVLTEKDVHAQVLRKAEKEIKKAFGKAGLT